MSLDLEEILEEATLEVVELIERATGSEFRDQGGEYPDSVLLHGVLHESPNILRGHRSKKWWQWIEGSGLDGGESVPQGGPQK